MAADKIKAGEAFVEARLEDKSFKGKLRSLQRFFSRKFPRSTKLAGRAVKALGTTIATTATVATGGLAVAMAALTGALSATVGIVGLGVKRLLDLDSTLGKAALRAHVSAEALSELQFAAEQSGASVEDINSALFRMQRRVANAATGTGPAVRALKELGLVAEDLARLTPDKQLEIIADALAKVESETLRAQFAFELLGDNAKKLVPLLDGGAESIKALRQEARDLGITIEQEDVDAAARLGDAINRIRKQFGAFLVQVGAAFAPLLEKLAELFQTVLQPALKQIERVLEGIEQTFESLLEGSMTWAEAFAGLWEIFKNFGLSAVDAIIGHLLQGLGEAIRVIGKEFATGPLARFFGKEAIIKAQLKTLGFGAENVGIDFELASRDRLAKAMEAVEKTMSDAEKERRATAQMSVPTATQSPGPVQATRPPAPPLPPSVLSAGTFSGAFAGSMDFLVGKKQDEAQQEREKQTVILEKIETNTTDLGAKFG